MPLEIVIYLQMLNWQSLEKGVRSKRLQMRTMQIFVFICVLVFASVHLAVQMETVNLGVIVDSTSYSGKIAKTALKIAVDDVNNQSQLFNGVQMFPHLREAQAPLEIASAAVDLLANKVTAITQTAVTTEASPAFVSDLAEAANVPILSLSDSSPALSNDRFPYFVRMTHNDRIQMKAIAALVKHYGWASIAFLHSDNDFGSGALSALSDALRDKDLHCTIVYTSMIPSNAQKQILREELHKLNTIKSSIFVLHAPCDLSIDLLMEAHEMGMTEAGYVWITTQEFTSIWDYVLNTSTMSFMQGLLGVKTHIPNSKQLDDFTERWERQFRLDNPNMRVSELNAYGLLAYDSVLTIARAFGKMTRNVSFSIPSTHLAVVANTKIQVFQQGRKLLQEIFLTNSSSLSGLVKFRDREMYDCNYEIVNVVGKSYQTVGFWSYNSSKLFKTASFSNEGLRFVIWPGGHSTVPRDWVIPNRLKIAVPVAGWNQLISFSVKNESSNETTFSGFIIDVFEAVVKRLDYQLQYDFVPVYMKNDSYDDLVQKVYLKKFDAVVGDVTITAERSEIVDFTQAFTETSLVIVAPTTIREEANNGWTFLEPFTPALWTTTAAFVISTGLVVWLLEHKINPDFRGSTANQVVTLLGFGFSAVFYAHRESVRNSLSRIVVVVWMFVAFVLTSSYTANLSSRLTAEQIAPVINGLSNYKVGYHGSYVESFLMDNLGVANKQLNPIWSERTFEEALSKGAKNGGVDAILDELPYVRAFLSGRCGYSPVGRTYQSGGFGFVFPKASRQTHDFSRTILQLIASGEIQKFENKYFKDSSNICPNFPIYSRLDVRSFKGLYLIIGIVSSLALTIFLFSALFNFIRKKTLLEQEIHIWKYTKSFVKYIYQE